jgi:hypothetical protein
LFHELAHAFHYQAGDLPADRDAAEVQAIKHENEFRGQLALPKRHPTNWGGGVGAPSGSPAFPRCKPLQQGFSWDCIVATAAVGSPHSPKVTTLRRAKREYRGMSEWARLISEPVLESYGSFSPGVVQDMQAHPELKSAMLLYAVQPAFYLFSMVEQYLAAERDDAQLGAQLGAQLQRYAAELRAGGGSAETLAAAADAASRAGERVSSRHTVSRPQIPGLAQQPAVVFDYLASVIDAGPAAAAGIAWALEGLWLFLRQAAAVFAQPVDISDEFLRALGAWLARLPVPLSADLNLSNVPEELRILGERLFNRDYTRELFAQQLLARCPAGAEPALHSLLRDHGYLPAASDRH